MKVFKRGQEVELYLLKVRSWAREKGDLPIFKREEIIAVFNYLPEKDEREKLVEEAEEITREKREREPFIATRSEESYRKIVEAEGYFENIRVKKSEIENINGDSHYRGIRIID